MTSRVAIVLVILLSPHALACSCSDRKVKEYFSAATYVFQANVLVVELVPIPEFLAHYNWWDHPQSPRRGSIIRITLDVIEEFKGNVDEIEALYTHSNGGLCGLSVAPGDVYVFFASNDFVVVNCDGSFNRRDKDFWDGKIEELKAVL